MAAAYRSHEAIAAILPKDCGQLPESERYYDHRIIQSIIHTKNYTKKIPYRR